MGRLVNGKWEIASVATSDKEGAYDRPPRSFRSTIHQDDPRFQPEKDRYHLYVSYACPWATRTLIYRELKDLQPLISVSVVHPHMLDYGWHFDNSFPHATVDHLYHFQYLHQLYLKADPKITTTVTVPVLWDMKEQTIVNNESSEIIQIFNSSFNQLTGNQKNYHPASLSTQIQEINSMIYHNINNGVYRAGFAKSQKAYDQAVENLFLSLDAIEKRLQEQKSSYLLGEEICESDLFLIPTLLRFDCVYHTHFKCNIKRIKDYPFLSAYLKRCSQIPAIQKTTFLDHIRHHYYYSHNDLNPYRIIAKGPQDVF